MNLLRVNVYSRAGDLAAKGEVRAVDYAREGETGKVTIFYMVKGDDETLTIAGSSDDLRSLARALVNAAEQVESGLIPAPRYEW